MDLKFRTIRPDIQGFEGSSAEPFCPTRSSEWCGTMETCTNKAEEKPFAVLICHVKSRKTTLGGPVPPFLTPPSICKLLKTFYEG